MNIPFELLHRSVQIPTKDFAKDIRTYTPPKRTAVLYIYLSCTQTLHTCLRTGSEPAYLVDYQVITERDKVGKNSSHALVFAASAGLPAAFPGPDPDKPIVLRVYSTATQLKRLSSRIQNGDAELTLSLIHQINQPLPEPQEIKPFDPFNL